MTMDQIQERANKFMKDAQKKKIKGGKIIFLCNKDQVKSDSNQNSDLGCTCLFCPKVFFSSKFLLKHFYRRHPEDLVLLYKKCQQHESINKDLGNLVKRLDEGFSMLKNEISVVKDAVNCKDIVNNDLAGATQDKEFSSNENAKGDNEEVSKAHKNVAEINPNEFSDLKEKVNDMQCNIQCLHSKFEELNNVLANDILKKQDIEDILRFNNEKILRVQESKFIELREILLKELQNAVSSQLHSHDNEWKLKVRELKYDIEKLNSIIDDIKKQLYSPDYINVLKEDIKHDICNFLYSPNIKQRHEKNLKSRSKISKAKHISPKENKIAQKDRSDKKADSTIKRRSYKSSPNDLIVSNKDNAMRHTSFSSSPNKLTLVVSTNDSKHESFTSKGLDSMLCEKLSHFNIDPSTSKIPPSKFVEKLRLIDSEKECLNKKYPTFSEAYVTVNMEADQEVHRKLRNKTPKKIRFSLPTTPDDSISGDENYHNKTYPFVQSSSHVTSVKNKISSHENREIAAMKLTNIPPSGKFNFIDDGGRGDYSNNLHDDQEAVESTAVGSSSGFKTSSPIKDIRIAEKARGFTAVPSTSSKMFNTLEGSDIPRRNVDQNRENSSEDSVEKCDNSKNYMINDSDEDSLKSLSSWED